MSVLHLCQVIICGMRGRPGASVWHRGSTPPASTSDQRTSPKNRSHNRSHGAWGRKRLRLTRFFPDRGKSLSALGKKRAPSTRGCPRKRMAGTTGLEPATPRSTIWYSNQLSYVPVAESFVTIEISTGFSRGKKDSVHRMVKSPSRRASARTIRLRPSRGGPARSSPRHESEDRL